MAEEPILVCGEVRKIFAGGGQLHRTVLCSFPGWFAEWWHGIQDSDKWKCSHCGTMYRRGNGRWVKEEK